MTLETIEDAEYHFAALVSIIKNSYCSGLDCNMCIFSHEKGGCGVTRIRNTLRECGDALHS